MLLSEASAVCYPVVALVLFFFPDPLTHIAKPQYFMQHIAVIRMHPLFNVFCKKLLIRIAAVLFLLQAIFISLFLFDDRERFFSEIQKIYIPVIAAECTDNTDLRLIFLL